MAAVVKKQEVEVGACLIQRGQNVRVFRGIGDWHNVIALYFHVVKSRSISKKVLQPNDICLSLGEGQQATFIVSTTHQDCHTRLGHDAGVLLPCELHRAATRRYKRSISSNSAVSISKDTSPHLKLSFEALGFKPSATAFST